MCVGVSVFRGAQVCLNLNLHLSLIGLSQFFLTYFVKQTEPKILRLVNDIMIKRQNFEL